MNTELPADGAGATDESVLRALTRASHVLEGLADQALKPLGLTWRQALALQVISTFPGISRVRLARLLAVTPQAAGTLARRMALLGLIEWGPSEPGSPLAYRVTPDGQARLTRADRIRRATELSAMRTLPTELCTSLLRALLAVEHANSPAVHPRNDRPVSGAASAPPVTPLRVPAPARPGARPIH